MDSNIKKSKWTLVLVLEGPPIGVLVKGLLEKPFSHETCSQEVLSEDVE